MNKQEKEILTTLFIYMRERKSESTEFYNIQEILKWLIHGKYILSKIYLSLLIKDKYRIIWGNKK